MFSHRAWTLLVGWLLCSCLSSTTLAGTHKNGEEAILIALRRLESQSGGRLGVAFLDTKNGRAIGYRGSERFAICSTFKLLVAAAVLSKVDEGHERLDRQVRFSKSDLPPNSPITSIRLAPGHMSIGELCSAMMTRSDNGAANLLLKSLGGANAITQYARAIGDPSTRLDRTEPTLNEAKPTDPRDSTTPEVMAHDMSRLTVGHALSVVSRSRLIQWLVHNATGARRLRAGLPRTWKIGDKTGTGGFGTTNDVAIIWPSHQAAVIVTVYFTGSKLDSAAREATIASVGKLVPDFLNLGRSR